jgi:hypothetical protein
MEREFKQSRGRGTPSGKDLTVFEYFLFGMFIITTVGIYMWEVGLWLLFW